MATTYAAHIITDDAAAVGDPEIVIMTSADETGAADPIASWPFAGYGSDDDISASLERHGWVRTSGNRTDVATGYIIVDVQPADWHTVIEEATFARAAAVEEIERRETGWRTLIRDAMNAPTTNKSALAAAARISRERAYQIRDNRR